MTQLCEICGHYYDDEQSWTICPHGPIWAPLNAYCREHDLVNCKLHGEPHEYGQLARGAETHFADYPMFKLRRRSKLRIWLADAWWDIEHWVMGRLGFVWSVQHGWQQRDTKVT